MAASSFLRQSLGTTWDGVAFAGKFTDLPSGPVVAHGSLTALGGPDLMTGEGARVALASVNGVAGNWAEYKFSLGNATSGNFTGGVLTLLARRSEVSAGAWAPLATYDIVDGANFTRPLNVACTANFAFVVGANGGVLNAFAIDTSVGENLATSCLLKGWSQGGSGGGRGVVSFSAAGTAAAVNVDLQLVTKGAGVLLLNSASGGADGATAGTGGVAACSGGGAFTIGPVATPIFATAPVANNTTGVRLTPTAGAGCTLALTSPTANDNLTINAQGTGNLVLGSGSTGLVVLGAAAGSGVQFPPKVVELTEGVVNVITVSQSGTVFTTIKSVDTQVEIPAPSAANVGVWYRFVCLSAVANIMPVATAAGTPIIGTVVNAGATAQGAGTISVRFLAAAVAGDSIDIYYASATRILARGFSGVNPGPGLGFN